MGIEIERKFLLSETGILASLDGKTIKQGYIPTEQGTVRIRTWGENAFITIKGSGLRRRLEFEYPIPHKDALQMLHEFCSSNVIHKTRFLHRDHQHLWEIDRFYDENEGLFIAEVELEREDEAVFLPDWLGQEVTGDPRYYNSNLIKNPYTRWNHDAPIYTPVAE